MPYIELLEHSYRVTAEPSECAPKSRLEYLSDYIFEFTTYDSEMSALFALKAVEVCAAINSRQTFDYIKSPNNHRWYLLMCNMPFFADRIEWGTSIRGAWWGALPGRKQIELTSCGIWIGDEQISDPLKFSFKEWTSFVSAIIEFSKVSPDDTPKQADLI